jgi:hypothetical protein
MAKATYSQSRANTACHRTNIRAAKALSSYFDKITVLERDALPAAPSPRAGTPQARQIHVLLRGRLDALASLDFMSTHPS